MFEFDWVQHIRMAFAKSKAKLLFLSIRGADATQKVFLLSEKKGKRLKLIDYIMLSLDR